MEDPRERFVREIAPTLRDAVKALEAAKRHLAGLNWANPSRNPLTMVQDSIESLRIVIEDKEEAV